MATISKRSRYFFFYFLLILSSALSPKTVIFDFNGVLADNSKSEIAREIGFGPFIRYFLLEWKNPANLNRRFFDLLTNFFGEQRPDEGCNYAYGDGRPLPQIMCDWLAGIYSGPEIAARTCACINNMSCGELSKREKRLFKKLAWTVFDPQILAKHVHPVAEGVALLKECAEAGNEIYLLSNFDPEGFINLYNKPEMRVIFDYIPVQNMVVSGFIGMIKPYGPIFDHLMNTYKLDKNECVFIDDQLENCKAASAKGLRSIQFERKKIKEIRKTLQSLLVLPA